MADIIDSINAPADLRELSIDQLKVLAGEIRELITRSVSQAGGHLASNLGVVELTIAMHYVFDFSSDKLLWDVGHQCYAHKILTGRKDMFDRLRCEGGLSGFPSPAESVYDPFSVGHAGTSIATALGMAIGARHTGSDEKIVAFVGDASIFNGLSFEAMNNLGLAKRQLLVVLNDNSMAIDVTQGALAKFLSRVRLSHTYEDIRKTTRAILEHLPLIGKPMEDALEKFKKVLRMQISPSRLFESLNIPYFGPVDGHDVGSLIQLFKAMSHLETPAILHVYTQKGKGFTPAGENPRKFHSTGPFEINGDDATIKKGARSYTAAFADALVGLARRDERVVAITAAMPDGTGLDKFRQEFPGRCYDVGIAESVAVDIAAGLAKKGMKPFVCVYSTFLQRGFDQVFQEVALQNLPVVFCIDRAGLVGNDGPTHHGLMDIGFMRILPNMVLISPASESEMTMALDFAAKSEFPVAIRYPKDVVANGRIEASCGNVPFKLGKSVEVKSGGDSGGGGSGGKVVLVALGGALAETIKAAEELESAEGIDVGVINARFAKPIDEKIVRLVAEGKAVVTVEEHHLACGFGSAVLEATMAACGGRVPGRVINLACPDEFIPAASRGRQFEQIGLDAANIVEKVKDLLRRQ